VNELHKVRFPLVLVNFKTYLEGTGAKALKIAQLAEKISLETGCCIAVAPQNVDIPLIAQSLDIPIFSQHIDAITAGGHTGHVLPEAIKEAGAVGTLINHSERRLNLADIEGAIVRAKKLDILTVVCTNNSSVSSAVASLDPDMIAIEPPELIGTGISVSKTQPEVVTKSIESVKKHNSNVVVLCGAGITNRDDVASALRLGTGGVLVASGIVKTKDPYRVMFEFAKAIEKF
jgi:triosephosphate isomerase